MVNSGVGRGRVEFGVMPDGTPAGIDGDLDTAQQSLTQAILQHFDPHLTHEIHIEKRADKAVLVVTASRPRAISFHEYRHRAYIREGSTTRVLDRDEKLRIERERNRDYHPGPWRCDRCGSFVGLLVQLELTAHGPKKTYTCECGGEFWPA